MTLEEIIDDVIFANPNVTCARINTANEVIDVFYKDGSVATLCDDGKGRWVWVLPEEAVVTT